MTGYYAGYADQAELGSVYEVDKSVPDFGLYVRWHLDGSESVVPGLGFQPMARAAKTRLIPALRTKLAASR